MAGSGRVIRRRQFCTRCGQLMFEYYCSLDGHFGLVNDLPCHGSTKRKVVLCPMCGARYRLLDRLDATGQPLTKV